MMTPLPYEPFSPCPTPFNMAAHVLRHAAQTPDKTAISLIGDVQETWSYADLSRAVFGVAHGFCNAGLQQGDRVLMRMGNRVEFPIVFLGAIAAGLIPVPTSAQLTGREVAQIAQTVKPDAIVVSDDLPEVATPIRFDLADITAWYSLPAMPAQMGDPDRPAYIIFTSGTSAKPRAVLHAHRAIWARQMMIEDWTGISAQDRVLHAGGFNWTYTLGTGLMDPWSAGATALIAPKGLSANEVPDILRANEISVFAAVPGIYRAILKHHDGIETRPDTRFLSAGEKLSDGVRSAWHCATGAQILEAYGMSECSTFLSDRPFLSRASGLLAQRGRRIALSNDGVICIHKSDPGLMLEYAGDPDGTAARYDGDWFVTGDHAELAADGSLILMGRADDMMNAGGFRVSPLEVEAALSPFEGLGEIAVTDVRIKRDVRVIAAFYTSDTPIAAQALEAFAKDRLARYKQPRLYIRLQTLPKGPNNKIKRSALRQDYEAQNGQA